jgi:hypothetical protein
MIAQLHKIEELGHKEFLHSDSNINEISRCFQKEKNTE